MSAWKDGELAYVAELLETRGNASVPHASVTSYLYTQAASGPHETVPAYVQHALYAAIGHLIVQDWGAAARVVRAAADAESAK